MRLMPLLLLAGCGGTLFEPSEDWVEYNPPPQYNVWHQEVETCVGIQRSFDDIAWRKVLAFTFVCGEQPKAIGCYVKPNVIYIVESAVNHGSTVKKELAHYIRQNSKSTTLLMPAVQEIKRRDNKSLYL